MISYLLIIASHGYIVRPFLSGSVLPTEDYAFSTIDEALEKLKKLATGESEAV